jgi:hypothetical protein
MSWAVAAIAAAACSSRPRVAERDIPARPALGAPIDRVGRPLTGNALIGLFDPDDVSDRRKEAYNRAAPADWPQFTPDVERSLALYDGFDGTCGNQWLAARTAPPAARYRSLARLLVDDRLWIDSRSTVCTTFLALELAEPGAPSQGCGGRAPELDAVDVFRSLLASGQPAGLEDGVAHDDRVLSATEFPFLAAP